MRTILWLLAGVGAVFAQPIDLTSLDKLASKAKESAVVTLDGEKLQLLSKTAAAAEKGGKEAADIVAGLKSVLVRHFEFAEAGQYNPAELDPIRAQLRSPGWSKIVDVKGKGDDAEVFLRSDGQKVTGLAVIALEPK